ncbi:MAG TPA: hypothetical protein VF728_11005 [Nocardioides sp.]
MTQQARAVRPEPEIRCDPGLMTTDERGASVPFLEPGASRWWPVAAGLAFAMLIVAFIVIVEAVGCG